MLQWPFQDYQQKTDDNPTISNIKKLCAAIAALPYCDGTALETIMTDILQDCGFNDGMVVIQQYAVDNFKTKKAQQSFLINLRKEVKQGNFKILAQQIPAFREGCWRLEQFFGKSDYPDHILITNGRVQFLEDKSTMKRGGYRYNNTLPHPKTFYVFSDKSHNATTLMRMEDSGFTQTNHDLLNQAIEIMLDAAEQSYQDFLDVLPPLEREEISRFKPAMRKQFLASGGLKHHDHVGNADNKGYVEQAEQEMIRQSNKGLSMNWEA